MLWQEKRDLCRPYVVSLLIYFIDILFIPIVKYTVKVYTPSARARSDNRLTVRIEGQGKQKTADHVLYETTQDTEGFDIFFCLLLVFRVRENK